MKKRPIIVWLVVCTVGLLIFAGFSLAQMKQEKMCGQGMKCGEGRGMGCGEGKGMTRRGGPMSHSMMRHHFIMRNGLSREYSGRSNPLPANRENLEEGGRLFKDFCAVCHGDKATGNGPVAEELDPQPVDLTLAVKTHMATDPYMFWTISEGGEALKTGMPRFKGALSEEKIWKIILHLRSF